MPKSSAFRTAEPSVHKKSSAVQTAEPHPLTKNLHPFDSFHRGIKERNKSATDKRATKSLSKGIQHASLKRSLMTSFSSLLALPKYLVYRGFL